MDQPGTVVNGDKITQHNIMGRFFERQEGEERLVAFAFELLALHAFQHFHFIFPKDLLQQCFCQDQFLGSPFGKGMLHLYIIHISPGCHSYIGGQRPGGGGPYQQGGIVVIHQG